MREERGQSAVIERGSRPWRIVPLAVLAVLGTVGMMGAAMAMVRDLSDHQHAQEVLQQHFASLDIVEPETAQP